MKKKSALVAVIGGVLVGGLTLRGASQSGAPAAGPKKAEEQFKNIQVLKGIPADQVVPGMQFITASLGVECQFCHVEGAFEKDDKKPKVTARKMMTMMFAINKDNFEGHRAVTCYSCHRGNSVPAGTPPVMSDEAKMAMAEAKVVEGTGPATGPTAEQLIDKYLQAAGRGGGDRQDHQPGDEGHDHFWRQKYSD